MKANMVKWLRRLGFVGIILVGIVGFSAFHARRISDTTIGAEIAPPPRISTRFVLFPERHMDGATGLGTRPGWVVSYAPSTRQYGSAFFVSFFGKMLARGTPALVHEQHERDQHTLEVFTDSFARLDAAIQEGIPFSNVVAILGDQYVALTNENGSFSAYYDYTPRSMAPVEWITNGFSLVISNGVVIHKAHSYMSSQ